jgi:CheY-like chemotaxis protein
VLSKTSRTAKTENYIPRFSQLILSIIFSKRFGYEINKTKTSVVLFPNISIMTQTPTLLLIDDDLDDQEIFELAVKEINSAMHCVYASSGFDALELLKNDPSFLPEYIFIDLNMPRMDGKKCLAEIRKMPHLNNVSVIIYSTAEDERALLETKQMGASKYIVKPNSLSALVDRLAELFKISI